MSMQLEHTATRMMVILPLIGLVVSLLGGYWFGVKVQPFPVTPRLPLPATLSRLPENNATKFVSGQDLQHTVNPFIPVVEKDEALPATEQEELQEVHLTTIARGQDSIFCFINGKRLQAGDKEFGISVHQIAAERVILRSGDVEFILIPGQKAVLTGGSVQDIFYNQDPTLPPDKSDKIRLSIPGNSTNGHLAQAAK